MLTVKPSANCEQSLIVSGLPRDWRSSNFWRQQQQLGVETDESRAPYQLFQSDSLICGRVVVLWSDLPPRAKLSKNFHQSVLCRRSVLPCFIIGCKQRSRNWQKTRTGQSLKTLSSCSYRFSSVTSQVQFQTVLLFLLDRQYISFLVIDGRHPVST